MEGTDHASFNWEWQTHELYATFDANSPLGTSHTLWEDLDKGERGTTPTAKLNHGDFDNSILDFKDIDDSSIIEDSDGENQHLKRRQMLHFGVEEELGSFACDAALCPSPLNCLQSNDVLEGRGAHTLEATSATSMWFKDILDDIDHSEPGNCDSSSWEDCSTKEKACEILKTQRKTQEVIPVIHCETDMNNAKSEGKVGNHIQANRIPLPERYPSGQSLPSTKTTIPIAYPFTVVKPSGIQGDVTLNDINKHIMTVHQQSTQHVQCQFEGDGPFPISVLEKPVLALTKIHTHGNGTITIMRTKN